MVQSVNIRAKVLSALRWTFTARLIGQILSWAITIIVIRLLTPSDYGLMAMAVVFLSFLILVNTLGLDAVLVQRHQLDELTRRQIFGIVILLNILLFFALWLLAPWIAGFFAEPRLVPIIRVLSVQFLILIFETLPQSQLEREIDFKRLSIVELTAMLMSSMVTLALAYAGSGVWTLVWGHLTGTLVRTAGLNLICPSFCWPSFSARGISKNISFGGYATLDRVLWFFFSETDKFIGAKLLGKELLGFYVVANHIASLPINKLAKLINSVAFPAFSRVQSESLRIRTYFLKAVRVMSILSFPLFLGLASVATEVVELVLGQKWARAALPLHLLALVMPIRMLGTLLPPMLWGVGRPDVSATNFLIAALVMPVAFFFGTAHGAVGLALAWLIAYPAVFLIAVTRACRVLELPVSDFVQAIARPALAGLAMYAIVVLAKYFAITHFGAAVHLLQLVVIGCAAYAVIVYMWHREGVRETWDLLRP